MSPIACCGLENWGRTINIASAHGLVGRPVKSTAVAAKHGMIGLTKVTARELANDGITVNAICLGWVLTPLVQKQIYDRAMAESKTAEATRDFLAEKQPMTPFFTTEGVGALAVFLCSDSAARVAGAPLSIAGDWLAR
jgi:3-hydroxybutyrate dehydrogenase